ncbi:hypothetical protein [Nocardioides speluncae]|uniref:hypothetical protein n=1 Tax=Nocardioides speluncae TaxID=2670337 RepID=UPI000D695BCF|nr:hypothetical protein [Nocardioides speluncae]
MKVRLTRQRMAAVVATAGLAATATLPGALAPSQAAPPEQAAEACPEAFPVADLAADQPVTGLTVSKGTTPDGFTGTVLGVLDDGIAPDLDMIMVRLTSPEIDRVGGIWAGMSGSPVYAADGRLIGAVAYGLALGPSPVAGVTPAADMQKLLTAPPTARPSVAKRIEIPQDIKSELVSSGDATASQAEDGLQRLPIPLAVSGAVSSKRLAQMNKILGLSGMRAFRGGTASGTPSAEPIVAGGNLAGSLSYGDFSAVGTGTATMVCGGEVVAFGHPFIWSGKSTLTMHGASALYVQEDPTLFPFKVSNATGPVGVIDQDRLAGIKGVLGAGPATVPIVTKVTLADGTSRVGRTRVSVPAFLPDAAAISQLVGQDRLFDQIGPGSAVLRFSVTGETKAGEPFTLSRANRFDSAWDISFTSIFELANAVFSIQDNEFTDVTFTGINVSVNMSEERRNRIAQKVQIWNGTAWKTLTDESVVRARPGGWVKLRTVLTTYRNARPAKYLVQNIKLPGTLRPGSGGSLSVRAAAGGEGEEFADPGGTGTVTSFPKLIESLANAPRNDQLLTSIDIFNEGGEEEPDCRGCRIAAPGEFHKEILAQIYEVVRGSHFFELRIIK